MCVCVNEMQQQVKMVKSVKIDVHSMGVNFCRREREKGTLFLLFLIDINYEWLRKRCNRMRSERERERENERHSKRNQNLKRVKTYESERYTVRYAFV